MQNKSCFVLFGGVGTFGEQMEGAMILKDIAGFVVLVGMISATWCVCGLA